jgi:dCTP deaminase
MFAAFKRYAVLSGVEIAEAVERQREYARLYGKACPDLEGETEITWWERRKLAWLEKQPRVHIDDFDPTPSDEGGPLNPNSYNLKLAPELLVYDVPIVPSEVRHAMAADDQMFERYALDMRKDNPTRKLTIPPEGLVLRPDRLYLARTQQHTEAFNLRPCLNGRSSIGRLGIAVHITAGYGDAGYCGTWTLEVLVVHPVRVYAGVGICQIDYVPISPRHRPYRGKYLNRREVTASRLYTECEPHEQASDQPRHDPQPDPRPA